MSDKLTVYITCIEVTGTSQKQSNTTVIVLIYSVCRTAMGKWAFASKFFCIWFRHYVMWGGGGLKRGVFL